MIWLKNNYYKKFISGVWDERPCATQIFLGQPKYFLGIDVAYSKQDIFISHKKYVLDHLQKIEK